MRIRMNFTGQNPLCFRGIFISINFDFETGQRLTTERQIFTVLRQIEACGENLLLRQICCCGKFVLFGDLIIWSCFFCSIFAEFWVKKSKRMFHLPFFSARFARRSRWCGCGILAKNGPPIILGVAHSHSPDLLFVTSRHRHTQLCSTKRKVVEEKRGHIHDFHLPFIWCSIIKYEISRLTTVFGNTVSTYNSDQIAFVNFLFGQVSLGQISPGQITLWPIFALKRKVGQISLVNFPYTFNNTTFKKSWILTN